MQKYEVKWLLLILICYDLVLQNTPSMGMMVAPVP